jgi:hypothetical protein
MLEAWRSMRIRAADKALGLALPESVALMADKVVE